MAEDTNESEPVRSVDLTGEVCPMTFVRAKLHLEQIAVGDVLELILKEGEQMRNVPKSIKEEGHKIERVKNEGNLYHLFVRKQK